jgi:hypothetical protein
VKAIRISHFGPPDVLVYVDEPVPQPKSGEAVVEVHAAGVGPWDVWMQEERLARPFPGSVSPVSSTRSARRDEPGAGGGGIWRHQSGVYLRVCGVRRCGMRPPGP